MLSSLQQLLHELLLAVVLLHEQDEQEAEDMAGDDCWDSLPCFLLVSLLFPAEVNTLITEGDCTCNGCTLCNGFCFCWGVVREVLFAEEELVAEE